eukprot:g3358.t1
MQNRTDEGNKVGDDDENEKDGKIEKVLLSAERDEGNVDRLRDLFERDRWKSTDQGDRKRILKRASAILSRKCPSSSVARLIRGWKSCDVVLRAMLDEALEQSDAETFGLYSSFLASVSRYYMRPFFLTKMMLPISRSARTTVRSGVLSVQVKALKLIRETAPPLVPSDGKSPRRSKGALRTIPRDFFMMNGFDRVGFSPKGVFQTWPLGKGWTLLMHVRIADVPKEDPPATLFRFRGSHGHGISVELRRCADKSNRTCSLSVHMSDVGDHRGIGESPCGSVDVPVGKWFRLTVVASPRRFNIGHVAELSVAIDGKVQSQSRVNMPIRLCASLGKDAKHNFRIAFCERFAGDVGYVAVFLAPLEQAEAMRATTILSRDPFASDAVRGGLRGRKGSLWQRVLLAYHPRVVARVPLSSKIVSVDLFGRIDAMLQGGNVCSVWSDCSAQSALKSLGGIRSLIGNLAQVDLALEVRSLAREGELLVIILETIARFMKDDAIGQRAFFEESGVSLLRYFLTHCPLNEFSTNAEISVNFVCAFSDLIDVCALHAPLHSELLRLFFSYDRLWILTSKHSIKATQDVGVDFLRESVLRVHARRFEENPSFYARFLTVEDVLDFLLASSRLEDRQSHLRCSSEDSSIASSKTTAKASGSREGRERIWLRHAMEILRVLLLQCNQLNTRRVEAVVACAIETSKETASTGSDAIETGSMSACHEASAELLLMLLWILQLPSNSSPPNLWPALSKMCDGRDVIPAMLVILHSPCERLRALAISVIGASIFMRPAKFSTGGAVEAVKRGKPIGAQHILRWGLGAARRLRTGSSIEHWKVWLAGLDDFGVFDEICITLQRAGSATCGISTYSALLAIALATPLDQTRRKDFTSFRKDRLLSSSTFIDDRKRVRVQSALRILIELLAPLAASKGATPWVMTSETQQLALMDLQLLLRHATEHTSAILLDSEVAIRALLNIATVLWPSQRVISSATSVDDEAADTSRGATTFQMAVSVLDALFVGDLKRMIGGGRSNKRVWTSLRQISAAANLHRNGASVVRHCLSKFIHTQRTSADGIWHVVGERKMTAVVLQAAVECATIADILMPTVWSVDALAPLDGESLTSVPVPRGASDGLSCRTLAMQILSLFESISGEISGEDFIALRARAVYTVGSKRNDAGGLRFVLLRLALRLLPMACTRDGARLSGLAIFAVYKSLKSALQTTAKELSAMTSKRSRSSTISQIDQTSRTECLMSIAYFHYFLTHLSTQLSDEHSNMGVLSSSSSSTKAAVEGPDTKSSHILAAASSVARVLERLVSSGHASEHMSSVKEKELNEMLKQWETAPTDPSWLLAARAAWLASQPLKTEDWSEISTSMLGQEQVQRAKDQWDTLNTERL